MASGKQHRTEGEIEQAKGAVKEGWGALTGDRSTEIEGKKDRAKGALRESYGELKEDIEGDADADRDAPRSR